MAALQPSESFFAALSDLAQTIDARAAGAPTDRPSYTAKLLAAGPRACAKKLGEEAVEAALAIASGDSAEIASETADLLYHLYVALASRGVSLEAVGAVLEKRQGISGIDEKATRTQD